MVGDTLVIYSLGNFLSAQKELFKLVGLLVSLDVVKTETPLGAKITLENVAGTLLYNPRRSPLGRYVVVPFDMMTEEILKDYITVHGRFSAYVKKDDTIDITLPAPVRK
jgi:poly-gamma-glutamate synthesis protein (capsule biosynthesis protein)